MASSMRDAFATSSNPVVREHLVMVERRQSEQSREAARAKGRREARRLRDETIKEIRAISYSRGHRLVPRHKGDAEKLRSLVAKAAMLAKLARPEETPRPASYRRDPEYPSGALVHPPEGGLDIKHRIAERNRLVFWLSVLEHRGASVEVCARVASHIERLQRRISRELANEVVGKGRGRREFGNRSFESARMMCAVIEK